MDGKTVLKYFNADGVVAHYSDAAAQVGLWRSEEKICTRVLRPMIPS